MTELAYLSRIKNFPGFRFIWFFILFFTMQIVHIIYNIWLCETFFNSFPNCQMVKCSLCGFKSSCSHLNFRFQACFEEGVPWHSGTYRVWIHSETRTWHDKNMQCKKGVYGIINNNKPFGLMSNIKSLLSRLLFD